MFKTVDFSAVIVYNKTKEKVMKISNGLRIATSNKSLTFKVLLYKLVVAILGSVFIFIFANRIISPVINSGEFKSIIELGKKIIVGYFDVNKSAGDTMSTELSNVITNLYSFILSIKGEIFISAIILFVIIQIITFLFSICDYVVAVNIHEHMSSMRHAEFFSTLFDHFKQAICYALYRTLMLLIYSVLIIGATILLIIFTLKTIGIIAISLVFLILFASIAVRLSIVGHILPKMTCENKGPFRSFIEGFKEKNIGVFFERFISYFVMVIGSFAIILLSAIVTFNVALLVTIPFTSVSFVAIRYVDYYAYNHKKYYVTFDDIVVPKELRQNDENLLNKVDI